LPFVSVHDSGHGMLRDDFVKHVSSHYYPSPKYEYDPVSGRAKGGVGGGPSQSIQSSSDETGDTDSETGLVSGAGTGLGSGLGVGVRRIHGGVGNGESS